MNKIAVPVLLSLLSLSVGFGASQLAIVGEVKGHSVEIAQIKEQARQIQDQSKLDREITDARINKVADLLNEMIRQNQELISLIRAQNQITGR